MVIGPLQPGAPPSSETKSESWLDFAYNASYSIGSGLMAIGERLILPVLETTGIASFLILNTLYQKYSQGRSTVEAAGEAISKHMTKVHDYKGLIEKYRKELELKTGGCTQQQLCLKVASLSLSKIKEWIINAPAYDIPLQKPYAKYFVTPLDDTKSELNFYGKVFKYVLETRESQIQDALEVNILKGCNNLIAFIKKSQEENPFILVDLAKDLLDEIQLQINEFEKNGPTSSDELSLDLFTQALTKKLLRIAFPHKGEDLINPLPDFISSSRLYSLLEEHLLPRRLKKSLLKALDQDRANHAVLLGLQALRAILSGQTQIEFPEKVAKSSTAVSYAKQKEFEKSLSAAMSAVVTFLDPALNSYITRFLKFPKLSKLVGPSIVKSLAKVNLVESLNSIAKAALPAITLRLHPKTRHEARESELKAAKANEEVKIAIEKEIGLLSTDISGVPVLAKKYLRAKVSAKPAFKHGLLRGLKSALKYYSKLLFIDIEVLALKIGISILGVRKQLDKTTHASYLRLKTFTIKQAIKPLTNLLSRILTSP